MDRLFSAIRSGSLISRLDEFTEIELAPILPTLLRASLLPNFCRSSTSISLKLEHDRLRERLLDFEDANAVLSLISVDFAALELELSVGAATANLDDFRSLGGPRWESAEPLQKHRLLLSYLTTVDDALTGGELQFGGGRLQFEPLDNDLYLQECCDIMVIAFAELPTLVTDGALIGALLLHANGHIVIQRLLLNCPSLWDHFVELHIGNWLAIKEDVFACEQRRRSLRGLLRLWPNKSADVVQLLAAKRVFPCLILQILCDPEQTDDANFALYLETLLLGGGNLIQHYINAGQKKQTVPESVLKLKERLLSYCDKRQGEGVSEITTALRLVVILRSATNLKFGAELTRVVLRLVCSRPTESDREVVNFVRMALATVLSAPFLLNGHTVEYQQEAESLLVDWLKWVAQEGHASELVLFIAIQFHLNQVSQLTQLATEILGFNVTVQSKHTHRLRSVFVNDLLDNSEVASQAARLNITQGMNEEMDGCLPVHCILHLLRGRSFAKHDIPIGDWILRQVKACRAPIHPAIIELLEEFARSCLSLPNLKGASRDVLGSRSATPNQTFSEQVLKEFFPSADFSPIRLSEEAAVCQLLMLFYLLSYESLLQTEARKQLQNGKKFTVYSEEFWDEIPVRLLLAFAKQAPGFEVIDASLGCLVTSQYPNLIPHKIELLLPVSSPAPSEAQDYGERLADRNRTDSHFTRRLTVLKEISRKTPLQQLALLPVIAGLTPELLPVSRPCLRQVMKLWTTLENLDHIRLYTLTARSLLFLPKLTSNQLLHDPLALLRCDVRLFRNPVLLEMLLRMVRFFLCASRQSLKKQLAISPAFNDLSGYQQSTSELEAEREDLAAALVHAQESAAVQILFEMCASQAELDEMEEKTEEGRAGVLREVRCLICRFVHQMFIEEPLLAKLVHFQGYSASLLPIVVRGIPSMHVCFDFLPELLAQPDLSRRVFACRLLSQLCRQFSVASAFSQARLLVDVYSTLLDAVPGHISMRLFYETAFDLAEIAHVFPPLLKEISSMLIQAAKLAAARRDSFAELMVDDGPRRKKQRHSDGLEHSEDMEGRLLTRLKDVFAKRLSDCVLTAGQ